MRKCGICILDNKSQIDQIILSGKLTDQAIADRFQLRSRKVVLNHRTHCIRKTLTDYKSQKGQKETTILAKQNSTIQHNEHKEMVSAWDRFVNLYDEIIECLEDAKKKKNLFARISSLKELREHIKLELDVRTASFQKEINKEAGQKAALIFNSLETIKKISDNPELMQLLQEGLIELSGKSFEYMPKLDSYKCPTCGQVLPLEGDPEILNRR